MPGSVSLQNSVPLCGLSLVDKNVRRNPARFIPANVTAKQIKTISQLKKLSVI